MNTAVLQQLLDLGTSIGKVVQSKGAGITLENAFDDPDVVALRDGLTGLLGAADTASALITATDDLHTAAAALMAAPDGPDGTYTAALWNKISALTAAERTLSLAAEVAAAKPLQQFVYAMQQLLPVLQGLAQVGVLVARVAISLA